MYTGKTKKFRDTIHGYIEIPDIIVKQIIDTELFQRLKHIEQTSMRPLYPAARHDRFIHSLGVYWLGKQAFRYFECNAKKELSEETFDKNWWKKQELLFSLACLLHDCAHAPFSHTLESLYILRKKTIDNTLAQQTTLPSGVAIPELDYKLLLMCSELEADFSKDFMRTSSLDTKGVGAPHEKMSSYCVINEYRDAIKNIYKELLPTAQELIDEDFVFIVRMIIGCTYSKNNTENSIKNCIISMLNSSSIDVDGLDYIVRDAYMSGIDNFSIDYQRLLGSFTIVPIEVYNNIFQENYNLDGIWLKGSVFTVKQMTSGMLKGELTISGLMEDDLTNIDNIANDGISKGTFISTLPTSKIKISHLRANNNQEIKIELIESCQISKSSFTGTIQTGRRVVPSITHSSVDSLNIEYALGYDKNSLSIIQSTVEARNQEYMWVYTHPKVLYCSNYLQQELLRDCAKFLCCKLNNSSFDSTKLIFDCKNCEYCKPQKRETPAEENVDSEQISEEPITNKTQTQGELVEWSSHALKAEEDFILCILGYETYFNDTTVIAPNDIVRCLAKKGYHFYRSCDDDINALFKQVYVENQIRGSLKSDKINFDLKEYFTRNQRKPLWKSFIEYENFISAYLTEAGSEASFRKICRRVVSEETIHKDVYSDFSNEQQEIFANYGIKNPILIKSSLKTKQLHPLNTYIKFKDQVLRLADVFTENKQKEKISRDFYYIYADADSNFKATDFPEIIDQLWKTTNP